MAWYFVLLICVGALTLWICLSAVFYKQFFKRFYDFILSLLAILVLSPLLIVLTVVGAIAMKGNPFFTQARPGKIAKKTKKERIFKLVKFRTMTNEKDENGNFLPDEKRLIGYGKFLRKTSLDELPELFNIFIGDMSIIGPRPLLVRYLPLYTEEQRKRHSVSPGLTGYAQVHGRNGISWGERLKLDVWYVANVNLFVDIKIFFSTVKVVFKHEGINQEGNATMESFEEYLKRTGG